MGYWKNKLISKQERADRIVSWYRYHRDTCPPYLVKYILEDDDRLWGAIQAWETTPFPPVPAKRHVSLIPDNTRAEETAKRRARRHAQRIQLTYYVGWALIGVSLLIATIYITLEVL